MASSRGLSAAQILLQEASVKVSSTQNQGLEGHDLGAVEVKV